jgi:hypothetical protein
MDCKEGTRRMANQLSSLLQRLDTQFYTKPLVVFNGSTVGQHFRHILDFYTCLAEGLNEDLIDYSKRERNIKIEKDKLFAQASIEKILEQVCSFDESKNIQVKADFSTHTADDRPLVTSSIGRELMFAYDHAVHHLAIIKIGIQAALPDFEIEEELGVAPATVKYRAGGKISDC